MKKHFTRHLFRFLLVAASLLSALSLHATYTLKVQTQCDADAIYSINERVRFIVTLTGSGSSVVPASADASWKISKDGVAPIFTGTVRLQNGVGEFSGTLDEPGFLYAEVTFTPAGGSAITAVAGAGVAPEQIVPSMEMPADFVSFWQAQKAALAQIPPNITYTATSHSTSTIEVLDIKADSIDGVPVSGYLVRPKGARPGSLPAILTLHGAGVSSASASVTWANEGFISLNINAHGILNGQPASYYTDLRDGALSGYTLRGRDSRETSYFRGMFMRLVRAIDVLAAQPEWDGKTLVTYGTSQGGAQSIAAAGLDSRVSFVAAGVTAMADHTGMVAGRVAGWPKWVTVTNGVPNAQQLQASRYYDVVNFAQLIQRDGTFTVGFIDRTCPPSTVYAMYNAWGGEKKTMFNDIHTGHANTAPALASMRQSILAHLAEQNTGIIFVRGSATEVDPGGYVDLTIRVGTGISSVTVSNGVGTVPVDAEGYATVRVYPQGSTSYMVTAQDSGGTLYTTQFEVTQNPLIPLLILSSAVQGNNYVIEFSGKPETTYAVKGSLNLEAFNDDFGTVTTNTQGVGNVQIPINPTETKRYFRIEVID